jgi:hypothetical protein
MKYDHPFEFVLETIKQIRRLKAEYNLSSKTIDNSFIYIKNDVSKLGLLLLTGFDIARLCQVKNLYVNFIDETDAENNFCIKFGENKQFVEHAPTSPIL